MKTVRESWPVPSAQPLKSVILEGLVSWFSRTSFLVGFRL
jgi:hypothetical protein